MYHFIEIFWFCNVHLSIPIGYAAHMKGTYKNVDLFLKHIRYIKYKWNICGDLKVMALMLEM